MKAFLRAVERIDWALAAVGGGLCLLAILLLTVATVYGRYIMETDLIPGGYNMIEGAFFPLMVFWGLPLAHREGAFPRLELLEGAAPGLLRNLLATVVLLVEALIYAVVAYYAARFAFMAWESGRALQIGTGTWPAWPVAMMAPVSFVLMLVEILRLLVADARRLFGLDA